MKQNSCFVSMRTTPRYVYMVLKKCTKQQMSNLQFIYKCLVLQLMKRKLSSLGGVHVKFTEKMTRV